MCAFEGHWIRDLSSSIPKAAAQRAGNSCQSSGRPAARSACPPRAPLPPSCPLTRVSVVGGVSRHREHLAPGHPPPLSSPLFSLSISPSRGLVGGSVMKFHIFIQGNNRKWSRPWNAVKQPSLKDISKPLGGQILYLLLQDSMHKNEVQSSSVSVSQS